LIRLRKAHFYIDKRRSEFLTGTHWTYTVINSGRRHRKKLLRKLRESSSLDDTSRAFHQIAGGSALPSVLTFFPALFRFVASLLVHLALSLLLFYTPVPPVGAERKILSLFKRER
jgi:hypothetical protein